MVTTRSGSDNSAPIKRVPLFRVSTEEDLASPIDRRSLYYRQQAYDLAHKQGQLDIDAPPKIFTLPTLLTLLRVALVPVLVACWYGAHQHAPVATAAVFITAAITDWLDGYLARRLALTSAFGAFLDPVADKVMVSTALILLATQPPPPISIASMSVPVSLIIAREITMSSLREWAAASGGDAHKAVKVSSLGKWKTALQMTAMSLLLVLRNDHLIGNSDFVVMWLHRATLACFAMLWGGTLLAVWSLARYMENVWEYFAHAHHGKAA